MGSETVVRLTAKTDGFNAKMRTSDQVLKDFTRSGSVAGQSFKGLTDALGINIGKLGPYGAAAAAASAAIKVFGDALKSNELIADEWGRITESAGAVYKGFITSLTQGDLGGFFSNMGNIIQSARDAYDALDALGTFDAFNQLNMARAQNKFQSTIVEYREGNATKQDVQAAAQGYKDLLTERADKQTQVYKDKVYSWADTQQVNPEKAYEVLSTYTNEQYEALKARQFTGTKRETYFIEGAYGMEERVREIPNAAPADDWEALAEKLRTLTDDELQAMQAVGKQAEETKNQIISVDKQVARLAKSVKGVQTDALADDLSDIPDGEMEVRAKVVADTSELKITDTLTVPVKTKFEEGSIGYQKDVVRTLKTYSESTTSHQERSVVNKRLNTEESKLSMMQQMATFEVEPVVVPLTADGEQAQQDINDLLSAVNMQISLTGDSLKGMFVSDGLKDMLRGFNDLYDQLSNLSTGTDEWRNKLIGVADEFRNIKNAQDAGTKSGKNQEETGKDATDAWHYAAQAVGSVGSALQSIEDPGAKVTGIVMQAVANIALGAATAISSAAANPSTSGWVWFAYVASAMATMAGTIAGIKSAVSGYAEGGIVKGAPNGGYDTVPAMLSPGEVVLNAAQQRNVAATLTQQAPMQNLQLSTEVRGERLRIVLRNNDTRRQRYNS